MAAGEFTVVQFYCAGTPVTWAEAENVDGDTASLAAKAVIEGLGARLGSIQRVIITDEKNNIVMEWTRNNGITWPRDLAERLGSRFAYGKLYGAKQVTANEPLRSTNAHREKLH